MMHIKFTRRFLFWSLFITFPFLLVAQPILEPTIGIEALPNDAETICGYPVPMNPDMTFDSYPIFPGATIPDFTFYDLNGNSINIAERLSNGKPIVLVGLNYTCPYVRNKVSIYNDIMTSYGNLVDIIGIYHLEAHPNDDFSPNSGTYGNVAANVNAGIVVDQHKTYLDRKIAAQDFIDATGLNIPVLLDGPCNDMVDQFWARPGIRIYHQTGWDRICKTRLVRQDC